MEIPFISFADKHLSIVEIVRLTSLKSIRNVIKKACIALFVNKGVDRKMHFLASKPLIIMQIPHNHYFNM